MKKLIDTIHAELQKKEKGQAPGQLLDFLSSVCVNETEARGHEEVQSWVAQLLCGLVSEGFDPHYSSLVYQIRLLATATPTKRLEATSVQVGGTAQHIAASAGP